MTSAILVALEGSPADSDAVKFPGPAKSRFEVFGSLSSANRQPIAQPTPPATNKQIPGYR